MGIALNGYIRNTAYIAANGLMDASLRLDVTANNVANANTDGFIPWRVNSVAQAGGGVRGLVVEGNAGMFAAAQSDSQTDLATEGVNLILARRAFQANAKSLKAYSEAETSLFEILA